MNLAMTSKAVKERMSDSRNPLEIVYNPNTLHVEGNIGYGAQNVME